MNKYAIKVVAAIFAMVFGSSAFAGGDIENGKVLATKKYACASCHGADFNSPIDPSYPRLAGQHPDYLEHALTAYKESTNPSIGRKNPIMVSQAAALSPQEIHDIAAYIGSLSGTLVTPRK